MNHKLSFASLLDGAPRVLPFELVMTIKPGFGPYATCEGEGAGWTLTLERDGQVRTDHYPNRAQVWERARRLQGRAS